MSSTLPKRTVLAFFLKGGATQSLFRWLAFRRFVAQKNLALIVDNDAASTPAQYLAIWEQQLPVATPTRWFLKVLAIVAMFVAFAAMAGVLNYSGHALINIWVPLALFAFIPFIFTLSSVYFTLLSPAKTHLHGHPVLTLLINKLNLQQFLPYKNVLLPWLFWQLQVLAIVFSLSALLSFFVLATFQDYRFGWSSTLIESNATMTQWMAIISWPWHWIIASPTAELISETRFSMQPMANVTVTKGVTQNDWWLTLVMAMVVYGVVPRLLLALVLRQRLMRVLRGNILHSADVEQFIITQQRQASHNPLEAENDLPKPELVDLQQPNIDVITWQQIAADVDVVKRLGCAGWLEDEQWLLSPESQRANPVWVIVDVSQTPTGELADCIDVLQQKNTQVALVLYARGDEGYRHTDRYGNQQKSWQFFAAHHQITLKEAR